MTDFIHQLAYLHNKPETTGCLKAIPEHFQVMEQLTFEPKGEGEHFLVRIRKIGENTKYVANELAKACGVPSRDVSWAGLKDRHAITEQWFSVHLPGKPDPDLTTFVTNHEGVNAIIATTRHDKKLRPGDLISNTFTLTLTDLENVTFAIQRLEKIKMLGVPNYFGNQRFGKNGNNITAAREWGQDKFRVKDKSKRSFYLSAARSYLFNQVVSARIQAERFHVPMQGDLLIDSADNTHLVDDLAQANNLLQDGWQISAPMTGDNALPTQADAQAYEQGIIDKEPDLLKIIRDNRMRHDRRAMLLMPQDMSWEQNAENTLVIRFTLPAGAFATAVMREVIENKMNGESNAYIDQ